MKRAPQAAPLAKTPARAWSPRALAVLSCALALLAAQPAMAHSAAQHRGQLELQAGGSAGTLGSRHALADAKKSPLAASSKKTADVYEQPLFLVGSHHLHILATLDILQRLLAAEIAPAPHHLIAALHFEAVCIGLIDWAPDPQRRTLLDRHFFPPVPAERAFAIEHCLLAPPMA